MTENTVLYDEKLPPKEKIAYGTASSAHMYLSGIGLGAIDVFYLKATGIAPSAMALSWILFIVWNMINDPLFGILQDKTKTKIGRRIPYLRYGSPIYVITFIWIWFPFVTDQEFLFLNHLLMLFVFDSIFSLMGLIFYSMPAEMALTAKERGNIMIYTTALGAVGTMAAVIVPLMYLGNVPDLETFRILMVITGIASGVIIYISSYYIKENAYTQMEETLGFFESIKETFKNKPFLIVEVGIFAMVVMQNVITGYFIFLMDYLVEIELNLLNVILFLILLALISYSIVWLNTHIEKYGLKKLMIIGGIIAVFGFLLLLIVALTFNANQHKKMPFILFFGPIAAILFGMLGFMLLNMPLMADCIDHDEVLTGKRRETTYSGINALITKPAVSLGHAVFLWMIEFYGYNESIVDPAKQPLSVATGVILAFTIVPIICTIIAIISMMFYPLEGEEWNKQKRKLQEIHYQKEKDYIEHLKKDGKLD